MWKKRTTQNDLLLNDYEFYHHLHTQNSPSTSTSNNSKSSHNSNSTQLKQATTSVSNSSYSNSSGSGNGMDRKRNRNRKHHHRENLRGEEQLLLASNKLRALANLSINEYTEDIERSDYNYENDNYTNNHDMNSEFR